MFSCISASYFLYSDWRISFIYCLCTLPLYILLFTHSYELSFHLLLHVAFIPHKQDNFYKVLFHFIFVSFLFHFPTINNYSCNPLVSPLTYLVTYLSCIIATFHLFPLRKSISKTLIACLRNVKAY